MTDFLGTIIIGLIIGVVAKLLMPGRDPGGCIITILLGIAGSFLAGFIGQQMGYSFGGIPNFIFSVIGAMILLLIYRMVFGKRT